MRRTTRMLLVVVALLPLVLTACYKDFEQMRIKPFRPDLVVPLAQADSVTVMDMLFKSIDTEVLETTANQGVVVFRYPIVSPRKSCVKLNGKVGELVIKEGKIVTDDLLGAPSLEIVALKLAKGVVLTSNIDIELPYADGLPANKIALTANTANPPLESPVYIKGTDIGATTPCTIKLAGPEVRVPEAKIKSPTIDFGGSPSKVEIGEYSGLVWYSGDLTKVKMTITPIRSGWVSRVNIKYWMEGFIVTKRDKTGNEETITIKGGSLPFNEAGSSEHTANLAPNNDKAQEYNIDDNVSTISKEWITGYSSGKFRAMVADEEVILESGDTDSELRVEATLKLPLVGKFDALVREFSSDPGNESDSFVLPDVNALLADTSSKLRTRFTDKDTVKLHFYFTNATPFEVYYALKLGKDFHLEPAASSNVKAQQASEIVSGGPAINDAILSNGKDKVGDFKFFKAVDCPALDGEGIVTGEAKVQEVTFGIPYIEYEKARKSGEKRQVQSLLLMRSPDGKVSSPRLNDYVTIRLGVEVQPEVEIELTNKNKEK